MRTAGSAVRLLIGVTFISLSAFHCVISQTNQSQVIQGVVSDEETGETLPGVHIYISQTTIGTVSTNDGSFKLVHQLSGTYKLVVSYVGYTTKTTEVGLDHESEPIEIDFDLSPAPSEMDELEVQASNSDWQNHFNQFRRYFLGSSEFAEKTIIENAWSLNFELDDEDQLIAEAPEPLVVTNYALGYEIEIDLVEFKWDRNRNSGLYVVYTRFNELKPETSDQLDEWTRNRRSAYRGSFEHFLKSLYNGELTANRFEAVLQDSNNRVQITEVVKVGSDGMNIHTNIPGSNSEYTKTFRLRGPVDILYGRNTGYSTSDNRTRSRLVPMNQSGTFVVTEHGRLANPAALRIDGAWAKDRVAKLIPVTYNPEE